MALDTSIIRQATFQPVQFQMPSQANMLANAAQAVSGLQTLESNRMRMAQMRQEQAREQQVAAGLKQVSAMGESPEMLKAYEDVLLQSGDPKLMDAGMKMRAVRITEARNKQGYETWLRGGQPAAAQPAAAPVDNALALGVETPAEPAAVGSQNMLVQAPAAPADPYAAQRQRYMADMANPNPLIAKAAERGLAQLPRLTMPKPQESKTYAPSPLSRLIEERDKLPVDDPRRKMYDAAIAKETTRAEPTKVEIKLPPQEKEEQGARGKLLVEQYKDVSNAARLATRTLPSLDTQANILDKGFKTGFGTDVQKTGASLLAALGVPEAAKFATDAQTFLAATQQAVLQKQLEQKGVQTQADADRITQTGAQLGNTPEANRFLIDVAKAQLKRDIEQRNFYDKWWKENKTYDGAEDAWFSGEGGKSLFDRAELKKYGAARPAATPAATAPRSSIREQADAILRGGR